MIDVIYPPLLNHPAIKSTHSDNYSSSTNTIKSDNVHRDVNSLRYLVSIPPGSGAIIEALFPEEGFYFGNDRDLASLLYGSGFVVSVDKQNSILFER
jgi:hypothetical protein